MVAGHAVPPDRVTKMTLFRQLDRVIYNFMKEENKLNDEQLASYDWRRSSTWKQGILYRSGHAKTGVTDYTTLINVAVKSSDELWDLILEVKRRDVARQQNLYNLKFKKVIFSWLRY